MNHPMNELRYQFRFLRKGLWLSELGDAVLLVAVEDFVIIAKARWSHLSGVSFDARFPMTASRYQHAVTYRLIGKEFLGKAADFMGLTGRARQLHPTQQQFLVDQHSQANVVESCLFHLFRDIDTASVYGRRCYDLFYLTVAFIVFYGIQVEGF